MAKTLLPDGSPTWLPQVERWLVGGAMLAEQPDVQTAAAVCTPADFRDESLGLIWSVMPYLEVPGLAFVAQALGDRIDDAGGEPRLVDLAFAQGAYMYRSAVCLEAHAGLVHDWGERRRAPQRLSEQARAVHEGRLPASRIITSHGGGVSLEVDIV